MIGTGLLMCRSPKSSTLLGLMGELCMICCINNALIGLGSESQVVCNKCANVCWCYMTEYAKHVNTQYRDITTVCWSVQSLAPWRTHHVCKYFHLQVTLTESEWTPEASLSWLPSQDWVLLTSWSQLKTHRGLNTLNWLPTCNQKLYATQLAFNYVFFVDFMLYCVLCTCLCCQLQLINMQTILAALYVMEQRWFWGQSVVFQALYTLSLVAKQKCDKDIHYHTNVPE